MKATAAALFTAALCLSACERPDPPSPQDARPSPDRAAVAQKPAPAPVWIAWDAEKDGSPRAYQVGAFNVTASKAKADRLLRPMLTISDGQGDPLELPGAEGSPGTVRAEFTAAALDRRAAAPQLLVRTFTYGAHCCFKYQLVERAGVRWFVHDLGQYDGAGMPTPADVDGDGRLELVGGDQRFLYAMTAYAFSAAPPQVQEVVDGKLVDVSADPRYRAAYERDAPKARQACASEPQPGACLAYAATMARLGRLDEAWTLVNAADPTPDRKETDDLDCWDGRTYCDADRKWVMRSFQAKVERFLSDNGYLHRKAMR